MSKQLTRSRDGRWVSGVCGGIAQYTGIDANLIRLAVVVLTIIGFGSVLVAYVVAWLLMPQDVTGGTVIADSRPTDPGPGSPSA